jgi:hypothetical protein
MKALEEVGEPLVRVGHHEMQSTNQAEFAGCVFNSLARPNRR